MSPRLVRLLSALASAIAIPVAFVGVSAVPSSATTYHSSGTVTFQGAVSGTLKISASVNSGGLPGCSISGVSGSGSSEGGTIVITWNNVKLKVGNKTQTLSFIELQSGFRTLGSRIR